MSLIRLLTMLCVIVLLQGCYVSDVQIIEDGDHVPLPPQVMCVGDKGKTGEETYKEESSGILFFKSYEYYGNEGITTFSNIDDDLYIAQVALSDKNTKKYGGRYFYVFYEFHSSSDYSVFVTNLMDKKTNKRMKELAKKHGVELKTTSSVVPKLSGEPNNIRAFLEEHSPDMFMTSKKCSKK